MGDVEVADLCAEPGPPPVPPAPAALPSPATVGG